MNDMADALKRALSLIPEGSGRPKKRQLMNHRHHNIRWPPISHTPQENSMAEAIKITVTLINQRGNKTIIKYKIECNNNKNEKSHAGTHVRNKFNPERKDQRSEAPADKEWE